ncbi:hypothetical protein V6N12_075364 [Hibiscus sabdariffa]|uniref:Uncharacterized protein n=1 Tax=Hibiscus sabdariffa TaxID=183260 RepID=A0ABR2C7B9_9ROSI
MSITHSTTWQLTDLQFGADSWHPIIPDTQWNPYRHLIPQRSLLAKKLLDGSRQPVAKLPLLPPRSQFWSGLPPLLKGLTSRSSAGNEDHVKGVVGLAKGLREVKSKYPLVMAVLSVVPEDHRKILLAQGCIVKDNEPT